MTTRRAWALLELLARHGDSPGDLVPVAIETPRGLLVACLRATGRQVFPVNPMSVARYRDRHSVAGRKSDKGDSAVLANVLRTDLHEHRPLPADSEFAQAVAVLARAQQDAVWDRVQAQNKLRSLLREYFPGFLAAFSTVQGGISCPVARVILATAPTPADAARLTKTRLAGLLRKAGRQRGIEAEAARLHEASGPGRCGSCPSSSRPWAARPWRCCARWRPPARARTTCEPPRKSLLASTRTQGSSPASQASARSPAPGCSPRSETTGPASRMPEAQGLRRRRPITRASGKSRSVTQRRVKNNRLATAGYTWAFAALTASPGSRAHYDRRREAGDRHTAAQRNLFNRLLGCLWHCLQPASTTTRPPHSPPSPAGRSLTKKKRRNTCQPLDN